MRAAGAAGQQPRVTFGLVVCSLHLYFPWYVLQTLFTAVKGSTDSKSSDAINEDAMMR
jgi:hypothetical protein